MEIMISGNCNQYIKVLLSISNMIGIFKSWKNLKFYLSVLEVDLLRYLES